MNIEDLTPPEKLYREIFGQGRQWHWDPTLIKHWLTPEGSEALENALKKVIEKHGARGERSVRVLRLRFGFEPLTTEERGKRSKRHPSSDARTREEVSVYFGVTRERIRQIEGKILRILRHPSYSHDLLPFRERREEV